MRKIVPFICLTIILGGCSMSTKNQEIESKNKENIILGQGDIELNSNEFVRVQDYNGDGYTLRDSENTKAILSGKHGLIERAVEKYFLTKHETPVIVHNILPAKDGATVFVESFGEPHFYTYAVVPVDIKSKKIDTDSIFTQEGVIESAITSSLYAMMYEKEFKNLDNYLEEIATTNPVTGLPLQVVERVKGNGYSNSFYFVDVSAKYNKDPYLAFIENPNISKEELLNKFADYFDPKHISIGITLYMKEDGQEPDEELYNKIVEDIKQKDDIPSGSYALILHDNLINKVVANATKKNSIKKTVTNMILKE